MQLYAIIVAGGLGTRMGNNLPKQLMPINGKPIIAHTITAFQNTQLNFNYIVVCHANYIPQMQTALQQFAHLKIKVIAGGNQRYNSVQNGLKLITDTVPSIVLVHDAVRCLVSPTLIKNLVNNAMLFGNAIPAIPVTDSMRLIVNNNNTNIDRATLKIVQTPQAFANTVIQPCFKNNYQPNFTDEATVCELAGVKINLIAGEETNIKITYPSDILFAENILKQ